MYNSVAVLKDDQDEIIVFFENKNQLWKFNETYYTKILTDSRDAIPCPSGSTIHMHVPHTAERLLKNGSVCYFHKYSY